MLLGCGLAREGAEVPPSLRARIFLARVEPEAAVRQLADHERTRFRVRAALRAEAERSLALRWPAARWACRESAVRDAAACPSRFSARLVARERSGSGGELDSCGSSAFVLPGWGGRSTPARRAFESPMAMACLVERAPCLPSRTWCISSRTNSPACVLEDLPARLSARARWRVLGSGMVVLRRRACRC